MTRNIAQSPPAPARSCPDSADHAPVISLTRESDFTYTLTGLDPVTLIDMISALRAEAVRARQYSDVHAVVDVSIAQYFGRRADSLQGLVGHLDACRQALCRS